MKSAFLASMSHELRTPLNSILGFASVMIQGLSGPITDEQTKQLEIIKKSGEHLLSLINDILDLSKIEAGKISLSPSSFDLIELVRHAALTVTPLAERKGLAVTTHLHEGAREIYADRRRVEQVLLNLLGNAVKFTAKGHVSVTLGPASDGVSMSVSDSGPGIAPEHLSSLFQPFFQIDQGDVRVREGTGLGLAISKRLVERLGGRLSVTSRVGEGSTFRFDLPSGKDQLS